VSASRFDLEQQIMNCWLIIEDLKLLAELNQEDDKISNYVLGLITIYEHKFEKLFHTFEQLIQEEKI
jgi:hypothetical protein